MAPYYQYFIRAEKALCELAPSISNIVMRDTVKKIKVEWLSSITIFGNKKI